MKLKTTKRYYSQLTEEKTNPIFLANPIYFREAAYVKFRNLNPNSISDTVQLSKSKSLNKIQFFSHKTQV